MTAQFKTPIDPKSVRRKLGLNQQDFWSRIGVTQSGGSRYEGGRRMPKPVLELLRVVHVERIDLSRVNREDMELIALLKDNKPEVYAQLREKVAAAQPVTPAAVAKPSLAKAIPAAAKRDRNEPAAADDFEESDYGFVDSVASRSRWSDDRETMYDVTEAFAAKWRR
jgi:hypothetical protein